MLISVSLPRKQSFPGAWRHHWANLQDQQGDGRQPAEEGGARSDRPIAVTVLRGRESILGAWVESSHMALG